jgi:hypothetical protein
MSLCYLFHNSESKGRDEHDILRTLVHGIRVDLLSSVLTEIEAGISKVILL